MTARKHKLPLVSVVTVCLNSERTIKRCLESVLAQGYPNIEFIVQDGGSTDGTLEILAEYEQHIKLVSEPDSCNLDGLFRALKRCQGEFIMPCWADDELMPSAVSWGVEGMRIHSDCGAIYGDVHITDVNGNITSTIRSTQIGAEKMFTREVFPHFGSSIFRRSDTEAIAPYVAYDHDEFELWMRLYAKKPIYYAAGVVSKFASHADSQWLEPSYLLERRESGSIRAINALCDDPQTPEKLRVLREKAIGGFHVWLAGMLIMGCADMKHAKIQFEKAFKYPVNRAKVEEMAGTVYSRFIRLDGLRDTDPLMRSNYAKYFARDDAIELIRFLHRSGYDIPSIPTQIMTLMDFEKLPLVSVITVCKNGARTIRHCIESVLAQDYPNIEFIVQDGGSTDGTLEILAEYEQHIKLVSEPDSCNLDGVFRALKRCRGEFIMPCWADDQLLPHAVSWGVKNMCRHTDAGAIYGDVHITDIDGNVLSTHIASQVDDRGIFTRENFPHFGSSMFRKARLDEIASKVFYDHDEFELWMRLYAKSPIYYAPSVVSTFGAHKWSQWLDTSYMVGKEAGSIRAIEALCDDPETPESLRALREEAIGGFYIWVANHIGFSLGDLKEAKIQGGITLTDLKADLGMD